MPVVDPYDAFSTRIDALPAQQPPVDPYDAFSSRVTPQQLAPPKYTPVDYDPFAPPVSKLEALGRGGLYGGLQQPRDVIAAGYAHLAGGVPFKEALSDARSESLEGSQGQAQQQHPGYFGAGQVGGNIATTFLPAGAATKAIGSMAPAISKIPAIGGVASRLAEGIGASRGIIGIPASGAIQGAVSNTITDADPATGAIGGAIGAGISGLVGKIARPIAEGAISPIRTAYVDLLKKAGINDLTPGQLTGNKNLELLDSVINEMSPTAGAARKKTEGQLTKYTSAILKKAGIDAERITPQVRGEAEAQFGREYGDLINNETIKIDAPVLEVLSKVESTQLKKLPTNVKPIVESYIEDIMNAGGKLQGSVYQNARSMLSRQSSSMSVSDPFTAGVLKDIRNALDGAANRSLPDAKKGAWSDLNRRYRNYKAVQKAVSNNSKDALEGIISPSSLLSAVETSNKTKGQAGYGQLYGLGQAGKAVLADTVPNSGTAQRKAAQQLLTLGIGAGGIGAGTYGFTHDPAASVAMAAGGYLAAPKVAQYLLNSPAAQTYFTKGIPVVRNIASKKARDISALLASHLGNP